MKPGNFAAIQLLLLGIELAFTTTLASAALAHHAEVDCVAFNYAFVIYFHGVAIELANNAERDVIAVHFAVADVGITARIRH